MFSCFSAKNSIVCIYLFFSSCSALPNPLRRKFRESRCFRVEKKKKEKKHRKKIDEGPLSPAAEPRRYGDGAGKKLLRSRSSLATNTGQQRNLLLFRNIACCCFFFSVVLLYFSRCTVPPSPTEETGKKRAADSLISTGARVKKGFASRHDSRVFVVSFSFLFPLFFFSFC